MSLLRTSISGYRSCNRATCIQCVVAGFPSSKPVAARTNAPVQIEQSRAPRACAFWSFRINNRGGGTAGRQPGMTMVSARSRRRSECGAVKRTPPVARSGDRVAAHTPKLYHGASMPGHRREKISAAQANSNVHKSSYATTATRWERMAYDYHIMTYTPLEREDGTELSVRMKTITKLIYLAFTVVILAIGAVTANGVPNDLFVSINGDGNNGDGSIYQYTPTGVQSIFASALSEPRGIAFGHGGNLFVANTTFDPGSQTYQATIVKITPGGVQSTFATLSGNFFGEDVAFDSSGNLFVIAQDQNDPNQASTIYKFTPRGVQSTFGSMPGQGFGLAFDGAGNLFAADAVFQTIWKFTPDGTRCVFVIASINPDQGPVGLAFDRFGNLFVSTESNLVEPDTILKFTPDGMQSTFAMNLTNPRGLAFDRSGNLFVSELAPANEILKFTPNGNQTLFASGIPTQPEFLAFELLPTPRLTR